MSAARTDKQRDLCRANARRFEMNRRFIALSTLVYGLTAMMTVSAHHSFASYDQSQTVLLKDVTVTKFEWTNPHSWIHVVVTNETGETENWDIECGAPNLMVRLGWRQKDIKAGDKITIAFAPLRDGAHGGSMKYVVLPDGTQRGMLGNVGAPGADGQAPSGPPTP
jgi:hypothetical protein